MDAAARILVVDDHDDTRTMLTRLLELCGYEADSAGGVEAALALAAAHEYDLVLCDVGLPDGDGCDLMRELRARHGLAGIALTGYGMPNELRRIEASGFLTHLLKPVEFDDLRAAIVHALARPHDRGEVTRSTVMLTSSTASMTSYPPAREIGYCSRLLSRGDSNSIMATDPSADSIRGCHNFAQLVRETR